MCFWDFDGTIADTPHPDLGKQIWLEKTGQEYPHQGWWGRLESMDKSVFDIKLHPEVLQMFHEHQGDEYLHFIHTSRMPKFENRIKEILHDNNIKMDGIMTIKGSFHKGERIVQSLEEQFLYFNNTITDVYFFDDRNKEIVLVESVRETLLNMGVNLHITKIQSDALD